MIELKRFLVPTDYSDCSRHALKAAVELAEPLGASLEVVHVWSAPYFGEDYAVGAERKSLFSLIRDQAAQDMTAFVESVVVPKGVTLTTRIESGEPVHRLLELIDEQSPDLVIVATHGRTGPRRWVLGSLAERLVQMSKSPVLTIPAHGHHEADKAHA